MKDIRPALDDESSISRVDHVYSVVRGRIVRGDYEPGERLPVVHLARDTGASTIPVREALRRLQSEGLVEFRTNRGARVTRMSEKDLLDIYAARRLLEGEALRLAHARLDQKALELGLRRVEAMVAALEAEDFARGELIHREVHFVLYEACGSAWMLRLIQILWDNSGRYLAMAPNLRPSPAAFGKEHERVINVSVNGSAEDAVSALCDHLTNTECLVRAHYYAPGLKSNSGAIVPMD